MLEMGLILPGTKLPPPPQRKTSWADNPDKEFDARAMAVHAAMIDRMDQGVGRILEKLRATNQLDNTLILFLSDNGASPEIYPNSGFDRPSETRAGQKIAYPPRKDVMPGPQESFFYLGPQWANVANTPLRYWKAETHEGGICTPLIAHWPAGLKTKPGHITPQPGHVIDIMATCLDLAGANYPKQFQGRDITPLEGKPLSPIFKGEQRPPLEFIAWEHFGARAIRQKDWKLVARKDSAWELYDLSNDRNEMNDLAGANAGRVKEMSARWEQWANATHVYPQPPR